jgi:hypothetical protein
MVTAMLSPTGREEQLHADPGDTGQRKADPDAAAEDDKEGDDKQ